MPEQTLLKCAQHQKAECLSRSTAIGKGREGNSSWQVEECSITSNILLVFVLALECHCRRQRRFKTRSFQFLKERLLKSTNTSQRIYLGRSIEQNSFTTVFYLDDDEKNLKKLHNATDFTRILRSKNFPRHPFSFAFALH